MTQRFSFALMLKGFHTPLISRKLMAQWGRRCWSDVRHMIDTRGGSRNIAAAHCHMDPPSFWRLPTRLSNNGAECPLMAQSGHLSDVAPISVFGEKRHFANVRNADI